ncbi:hypothetical protein B0H11DRAFT_1924398 [Mycena galericulata]|nr:hypothetical protein B0H11DRAFT_1924398 [Mycena galericulata]
MLISKQELTPIDVIDRGVSRIESFTRFAIETGFALKVAQLRRDFQNLLSLTQTGPSQLPRGTSDSVGRLTNTIRITTEVSGQYESEYRAELESDILLSPVSTDSGLYEALTAFKDEASSNLTKLAYLYEVIPHLKASAPEEDENWLVNFEVPEALAKAFPPREAEDRPSTVYYSAEGNRLERELPSNTSWRGGKEYSPPDSSKERSDRRRRLKKRVSIAQERKGKEREILEYNQLSEEEEERKLDADTYQKAEMTKRKTGISYSSGSSRYFLLPLGPNTPYKSAEEFFPIPKTARGAPNQAAVPNSDAPDPLYGMAASSYFGSRGGDSISQARLRQPRGPTDDNRFERWTGNTPVRRSIFAEVGSISKEFERDARRDPPPHLAEMTVRSHSRLDTARTHNTAAGNNRDDGNREGLSLWLWATQRRLWRLFTRARWSPTSPNFSCFASYTSDFGPNHLLLAHFDPPPP